MTAPTLQADQMKKGRALKSGPHSRLDGSLGLLGCHLVSSLGCQPGGRLGPLVQTLDSLEHCPPGACGKPSVWTEELLYILQDPDNIWIPY